MLRYTVVVTAIKGLIHISMNEDSSVLPAPFSILPDAFHSSRCLWEKSIRQLVRSIASILK